MFFNIASKTCIREDAIVASFLAIHKQIDVAFLSPNPLFLKLMFSTPGSLWDARMIIYLYEVVDGMFLVSVALPFHFIHSLELR